MPLSQLHRCVGDLQCDDLDTAEQTVAERAAFLAALPADESTADAAMLDG